MTPEETKSRWRDKRPERILTMWDETISILKADWTPGKTVIHSWHICIDKVSMNTLANHARSFGWRVRWCYFKSYCRGWHTQIELRAPEDCRWWEFWWWCK